MKRIAIAICIALAFAITLTGCPSKQTVSQLVGVLGNASAQIATLEGNSPLAAKITTDTAAAVSAIASWQAGSPSEQAVQALNLVVADLNLIPGTSQYAPLIVLAVATAESIIAILAPPQSAHASVRRANVVNAPATAKDFKAQWNAIAHAKGLTKATI